MQEVDHYADFIEPVLAARGYQGIYQKKGEWHRDGLCILFKTAVFDLTSHRILQYEGFTQFAVIAELVYKPLGLPLVAATTHLKAKKAFESDRVLQIQQLVAHLEQTVSSETKLVLGMDMNSEPSGLVYAEIMSSPLQLVSLYSEEGKEPEFTTCKHRKTLEKRTIDYLFTRGLAAASLYSLPSSEAIGQAALPSVHYPSDHLALAAGLGLSPRH
jgi:endonuclease/exonuclease/phosphatase family metal-dependent hydrolase